MHIVADDEAVVGGAVVLDGDVEVVGAGAFRERDGELAGRVVEGGGLVADPYRADAQAREVEGEAGGTAGAHGDRDAPLDLGSAEREFDVVVPHVEGKVVFARRRRKTGLDGGRLGSRARGRGLGRAACGGRREERGQGEEGAGVAGPGVAGVAGPGVAGVAGWWHRGDSLA